MKDIWAQQRHACVPPAYQPEVSPLDPSTRHTSHSVLTDGAIRPTVSWGKPVRRRTAWTGLVSPFFFIVFSSYTFLFPFLSHHCVRGYTLSTGIVCMSRLSLLGYVLYLPKSHKSEPE
jgi:hypothetical protein